MEYIENHPYGELAVGQAVSVARTLTLKALDDILALSDDLNPAHWDVPLARSESYRRLLAQGSWAGALVSALTATELPGPGTAYVSQSLSFPCAIDPGDTVTAVLKVAAKIEANRHVLLDCRAVNQRGEAVISGTVEVVAPAEKVRRPRAGSESGVPGRRRRYQQLMAMTRGLEPLRIAVVHPVDGLSLLGAVEAARAGLVVPVLVGPERRIRAAAEQVQASLDGIRIVATEHSHAAALAAVGLARDGGVEALMKGALHTGELMRAVLDPERGLRTGRRVSHVFAVDAPAYPRPLLVTDAAINIYPSLAHKKDIVQNAVDLARVLGIGRPRVAILSAVETVEEGIRSTLDAAALCKMAERGQISGAVLDGPLAFDNAVSKEAAAAKGIASPVAGHADVFLVPDLEAGNILAKQLEYLADAQMAGIVLGARVPIVLTSRADKTVARLGSCAIALLLARRRPGSAAP